MEAGEMDQSMKRGCLEGDYEIYHIRDKTSKDYEFHYHEFHKIIIFISGKVTYMVEGKSYNLKPWDILLVSSHEVHKPIIYPEGIYERMVIWINSGFLKKNSGLYCSLLDCFEKAASSKFSLLRPDPEYAKHIRSLLVQLEDDADEELFGADILRNALFIQFMVYLNRLFLGMGTAMTTGDVVYDPQIEAVLAYIRDNLTEDLSISRISNIFFMSKYHLMHKFKQQTGYTLHNYILQKRLIAANALIRQGHTATQASLACGFGDYANFVRCFKRMYGTSPRNHFKTQSNIENAKNKSR